LKVARSSQIGTAGKCPDSMCEMRVETA